MSRERDNKKKDKKPKRAKKYFEVVYEGGAVKQRKKPLQERALRLDLVTQIGKNQLRMEIGPLNGEGADIVLHQFLRKPIGVRRFRRDELPGVSVAELLQAIPFAQKLRDVYINKDK